MLRMGTGAVAEALRVLRGDLPLNLLQSRGVPLYRQRFPPATDPATHESFAPGPRELFYPDDQSCLRRTVYAGWSTACITRAAG